MKTNNLTKLNWKGGEVKMAEVDLPCIIKYIYQEGKDVNENKWVIGYYFIFFSVSH